PLRRSEITAFRTLFAGGNRRPCLLERLGACSPDRAGNQRPSARINDFPHPECRSVASEMLADHGVELSSAGRHWGKTVAAVPSPGSRAGPSTRPLDKRPSRGGASAEDPTARTVSPPRRGPPAVAVARRRAPSR